MNDSRSYVSPVSLLDAIIMVRKKQQKDINILLGTKKPTINILKNVSGQELGHLIFGGLYDYFTNDPQTRQPKRTAEIFATPKDFSSAKLTQITASDTIDNAVSKQKMPSYAKNAVDAVIENQARVNVYNFHGISELRRDNIEFAQGKDAYVWLNEMRSVNFDVRYTKKLLDNSGDKDRTIESIVEIYKESKTITDAIKRIQEVHHLKISKNSMYRVLDRYAFDVASKSETPIQWIRKHQRKASKILAQSNIVVPCIKETPGNVYVLPSRNQQSSYQGALVG